MGMFDYIRCPEKVFMVYYKRTNKSAECKRKVQAASEQDIRTHWSTVVGSDKFIITKIEEVA